MTFFYRAEVKGIQRWILASNRLREIKGGSAVVEGLDQDARALAQRTGGDVIIAAAGSVEILFTSEGSLRRFVAAWPLVLAERAPGLALVQAWGPVADTRDVYRRLAEARNDPQVDLPEAGPLLARSGRTGLPAVGSEKDRDGLMDRAIAAKLRALDGESGLDALAPSGWEFLDDANLLGERYLAVIHADGNGVGRIVLAKGRDLEWKKRFSKALAAATHAAATDAITKLHAWSRQDRNHVPLPEGRRGLRARPVVLGGDDLTFIVDACYGIPFTAAFMEAFERRTKNEEAINGAVGLTCCAGIAFVKTGFPFYSAYDLAESLCQGAKRALREPERPTPSGLLFHRVTTASTETAWDTLLGSELRAKDGGTLSAGPYTLTRLEALSKLTVAAGNLPRGSLREWLSLVRDDPARAAPLWQRTREVADSRIWFQFASALSALGHEPSTGWEPLEPGSRTGIGDALLWRTVQPNRFDRLRRDPS